MVLQPEKAKAPQSDKALEGLFYLHGGLGFRGKALFITENPTRGCARPCRGKVFIYAAESSSKLAARLSEEAASELAEESA